MKIILSFLFSITATLLTAQTPEPPPPPPPSGDRVFQKVEIEPSFPGGEKEWKKYLLKNLNSKIPFDSGAPAGTYTIYVEFVVAKDGVVSAVRALTSHGYGMEEEAIRLIIIGPNWLPMIQNGRKVKAKKRQPITFMVAG